MLLELLRLLGFFFFQSIKLVVEQNAEKTINRLNPFVDTIKKGGKQVSY